MSSFLILRWEVIVSGNLQSITPVIRNNRRMPSSSWCATGRETPAQGSNPGCGILNFKSLSWSMSFKKNNRRMWIIIAASYPVLIQGQPCVGE